MGRSLHTNDPTIVAAFRSAVERQGLIALVVLAVAAVAWNIYRSVQARSAARPGPHPLPAPPVSQPVEPAGRQVARTVFGALWVLDGLLQLQGSMALGMPSGVLQPAADGSPGWVHDLVHFGITVWSNHPVTAAASVVWIQIGIGVWLLVAPRGRWSQIGGLASMGWGVVVWTVAEAFGGIFAPGATWLFGAPGAVLLYVIAGGLIALPERVWIGQRLGRIVTGLSGTFFVGMAVLQAWPGRGFWHGRTVHGGPGTLARMVEGMAATPQPAVLSSMVHAFARFDVAHGWGVNLFAVVALAATGLLLLSGRHRLVVIGAGATAVLCLADWVLVEDLGFLGGVGTDPNSMLPILAVVVIGTVALLRPGVGAEADAPVPRPAPAPGAPGQWWARVATNPGYLLRLLMTVVALGVVLIGAAPMALAATNPVAAPILSQAVDGSPEPVNAPAPPIHLIDQHGRAVTLATLHGRAVALTFLDPVCTVDCPVIAQELRLADQLLGNQASRVAMVAVVANPLYHSVADVQAFDHQEHMDQVANWLFLTGSPSQLKGEWRRYGQQVDVAPGGAMVAHSEYAIIITPAGRMRYVLDDSPGQASSSLESSFAGIVAADLRSVIRR